MATGLEGSVTTGLEGSVATGLEGSTNLSTLACTFVSKSFL